ncbi:MAG TPA: hypothetical protein VMI35_12365 [Puia sp.]|nr:hypothetical protein [Puia sp.]
MLTIIVEAIGDYLGKKNISNFALYNFFSAFEFVFYFFVLSRIIVHPKARKVTSTLTWIYPIIAAVNILFIQKINNFHTITYSLGSLGIVSVSIYYFYELFQMQHSVSLGREPAFWIVTGLLFFYTCAFPLLGFVNFISGAPKFIERNLAAILSVMNVFLYLMFTIAFLCRINIRKST